MESNYRPTTIPLDEVLSNIGLGWFHVRLWWICGFGFSAAAAEVVVMSFVFPELRTHWQLNEYQLGSLATVVGCGSIFGETLFGTLADQYGRKPIFMATIVFVVCFGILSAFATDIYGLAALRVFVGFGYGGNIAVDFTMYSEFLPTEGRGMMLFLMTTFWPLGQIFTCVMAWSLIPTFGWPTFLAACTIPMAITAFFRPFIPESPRWLLTQGRFEEATEVCVAIAQFNGKSLTEVGLGDWCQVCLQNEVTGLDGEDVGEQTKYHKTATDGLFGPAFWRTTLGLLIVVAALNYTGYGVLTLMPSFMEAKGIPKTNMYFSMVMNSVAQIPGVIFAGWGAVTVGRLIPLRIALFIVGVALFGFAMVSSKISVLACTMFASCFLEAGWSIYHVYVPEVYPTELRASATGILSAGGSVVAMAAPIVSAGFLQYNHAIQAILVFSGIAVAAAVFSFFLLHVETKDRDLEDLAPPMSRTLSKRSLHSS